MKGKRRRRQLGYLGVDWRITSKVILKKYGMSVESIHLAQNRVKWRNLVHRVMNLRVP
jgi:hypothetical protein